LYCCFGTYNATSPITTTIPFQVIMAPSVLLANQIYAVNISVYISGTTLLVDPSITFNLYCNNTSTTYYPQIFSNNTIPTTPMYLTSTSVGPNNIYTGSINDYVSYTAPIDTSVPTLNVYISPTSGSPYTVKITATINPVST
jgi:hypothetical protein